jgi:putative transposon-encoded protein
MKKEVYLECKVEDGFFKSEAAITIQGIEQKYQALVDRTSIKGNSVKVDVAKKYKKGYFVDLPKDTFIGSPRVYVSADKLKTIN